MTATAEKHRVLVVDDNRDAATTLGILLESAGYEVHTCFDGKSALKEADRFAPDACVLDINMPGMSGYELARRLREKALDRPPVLVTVTAFDDYNHLTRAAAVGFDLHFTKPANAIEVAEQIADEVKKHAAEWEVTRRTEGLADTVLAEIDEARDSEEVGDLSPAVKAGRAGHWLVPAGVAVATVLILGVLLRQVV
jgi:two-component system, OmpR family, response regulator